MKNKILILLNLILAYRVSAQHSQKPQTSGPFLSYREYIQNVYYDNYTVSQYDSSTKITYFTYYRPGPNFRINTDSLLTVFAPILLEDSIEIKYAEHKMKKEINGGWTIGTENIVVGIRFKKWHFWIPMCDSALILKYLRANDTSAAQNYLNLYKADDKHIEIGYGIAGVSLGVWAICWFSPVVTPIVAPFMFVGICYSTLYVFKDRKDHGTYASNTKGMVSHYNTSSGYRLSNKIRID